MIAQRYRTVLTKDCSSINHIIEVVSVEGSADSPYLVTGGLEQKVQIFNVHLDLIQEIQFKGWIRCSTVVDLDGDGNLEFSIGSGDSTVRVFKYSSEDHLFFELWSYTFKNKVSSISSGDINCDGRIEIIAGSWDKTVKVFDGLTGTLLWDLNFSDWVTKLAVLDSNSDGVPEIIIGLKKGQFGVINGFTGECYWDFAFPKRINDFNVVFLANNQFPHLIAGGNGKILYFFDYQGKLVDKFETPDRILSITHGDINGNGVNEIILGLANNVLEVYESDFNLPNSETNDELEDNIKVKLRWKARLSNTPTDIKIHDIYDDSIPRIILTGYSKQIKILEDFYYGKEQVIVQEFDRKAVKSLPLNQKLVIHELIGKDFENKLLLDKDFFFFPKKIQLQGYPLHSQIKTIYNDLVEKIEKPLDFYLDLDIPLLNGDNLSLLEQLITNLLKKQGNTTKKKIISILSSLNDFTEEKISSAIVKLKNLGDINYSRKKPQGYYFVSKETTLIKKPKMITKTIQDKPIIETVSTSENKESIFIEILSKEGTVGSKLKLEKIMIESGLTTEEFITIFKSLKEQNILIYSRSTPRGYSVLEPTIVENLSEIIIPTKSLTKSVKKLSSKPIAKTLKKKKLTEKTVEIDQDIKDKFINLIQTNPPISSKLKLIGFMIAQGIEKKNAEIIFSELKQDGFLKYSQKKPKGYSINK